MDRHTGSQRLLGKTALVFGAGASGPGWSNGRAAAALYARAGARVFAVDRNLESAQETGRIIAAEGNFCVALAADVTDSGQVQAAVRAMLGEVQRIDVLHNNVGITGMSAQADPAVEMDGMDEETWRRVIDTNLGGVFLTCKHVLPAMRAQGAGSIVNISSVASIQVNSYPYTAYYAAKAGLNHLTRALAVRHAPHGIRVNAVLPGIMDTPLIYTQIAGQYQDVEEMRRQRHAASPMGRMGDAWDVAHAALFLASDEARYITGVCLPVDGGKSCVG